MTIQQLLNAAKRAGDLAAMSWYASDASDSPEPNGHSRIVITDADWSARLITAGEATVVDGGAQLAPRWEYQPKAAAISFAQHWSRAFVAHLIAQGIDAVVIDEVKDTLDTRSLKRGLHHLASGSMECISVETFHDPRQLWVSRRGDGPFVLQLIRGLRDLPTAPPYLAAARARGLEVRDTGNAAMVGLGNDQTDAATELLRAIEALFETPPTMVVARYAPVTIESW
ncbi:MAG: hypothetical protein AAFV53_07585 [Myxococcota bacterium]